MQFFVIEDEMTKRAKQILLTSDNFLDERLLSFIAKCLMDGDLTAITAESTARGIQWLTDPADDEH